MKREAQKIIILKIDPLNYQLEKKHDFPRYENLPCLQHHNLVPGYYFWYHTSQSAGCLKVGSTHLYSYYCEVVAPTAAYKEITALQLAFLQHT